jgi:ABC-type nitrate/sulfonate/bicarbonate transport system substrate-binding protein
MQLGAVPRRAGAVIALSAAIAGGCRSREPDRIILATVPLAAVGLVFIAETKGYFRARGVTVEDRRFSSGRDGCAALGRGEVEVAVAFETPVVLRAAVDPELDVITALESSSRSTRLVARADRGIRRDADLTGKRVGVPRNTNAESFLHALLQYASVPSGAVERVDVAPEQAADILAAGQVDAIAIWPPHVARARRLLGDGAVEFGTDVYTQVSMLVTRDSVLERRRATLVKLVRALSDAERLVRERPEEAFEALAAALPDQPREELREAWAQVRPGLGLSHLLAHVLEAEWERLRGEQRLTGTIDLPALIEPDVLSEVDPEAVTLVLPPRRPFR